MLNTPHFHIGLHRKAKGAGFTAGSVLCRCYSGHQGACLPTEEFELQNIFYMSPVIPFALTLLGITHHNKIFMHFHHLPQSGQPGLWLTKEEASTRKLREQRQDEGVLLSPGPRVVEWTTLLTTQRLN